MDNNVIGLWICGICILGLLIFAGHMGINEQRRWDKFAVDYHCKVVGEMNSEMITTFSSSGNVGFGSTEAKTGYLCDDNITYWR